jgi:ribosome-binding protein aMBF1 (putative translation factor)
MAKIVESDLVEVFAARMREERKHLGMSQEELAFVAGLDRTCPSSEFLGSIAV